MKSFKLILKSLLLVAPWVVAIWIIDIIFDKLGILQGEWEPLIYIIPILVAFAYWLYKRTRW